jgi:hypothetical protein
MLLTQAQINIYLAIQCSRLLELDSHMHIVLGIRIPDCLTCADFILAP